MDFAVLRSYDNYFTANIILTRLQDAGVQCLLLDEHTVTIDPLICNAIGGIKLAVAAQDESTARLLLSQFDDDYMKAAVCPKCKARGIVSIPANNIQNKAGALLSWLFGSYAVSAENVYHCNNCGWESKVLPEPDLESEDLL